MEVFQYPRRASQVGSIFMDRLTTVAIVGLSSINIPDFIWGCGGDEGCRDRGTHVQGLSLGGCSVPVTMECARSLWAQAPPALSVTLHNIPSSDFALQHKQSFIPATKSSRIEQIPRFCAVSPASAGWDSPILVAAISLSSSSSSLNLLLSRMFSSKVILQQLSRSFPLSNSAGKEIFENQSAFFLCAKISKAGRQTGCLKFNLFSSLFLSVALNCF